MVATYVESCDLFVLGKNDEMRQKSDKFFLFFSEFINQIHMSMPKVDKPKANKGKRAAQAALMAEMMAKNAKK